MQVTGISYYGEQIYDFEFSPDVMVNELSEEEVEDRDSYHKSQTVENQSGKEIIITQVDNGDKNRFLFKITDEGVQQCKYTGEDPDAVPPTVLHAVHENGYSVTNVETLGDWFNIWLDIKLARLAIHDLVYEPGDAIHENTLRNIGLTLHALEEVAGVRYLIKDHEEFGTLIDNSDRITLLGPLNAPHESLEEHEADANINEGELIRNVEVSPNEERLLNQVAEEHRSEHKDRMFNPDNFEVENIIVKPVFPPDDSKAFVDLFTPWGVERFNFQIGGACHYIKSNGAHSERPNSYVTDAIQFHGHEVENASSLFESVDTGSVVRTVVDVLTELRQISEWRGEYKRRGGPEVHLSHIAGILILRILVAVEAAEIAPRIYREWEETYTGIQHENPDGATTIIAQVVEEMTRTQKKELGDRLAKSESIHRSVIEPNYTSGLQLANNISVIL